MALPVYSQRSDRYGLLDGLADINGVTFLGPVKVGGFDVGSRIGLAPVLPGVITGANAFNSAKSIYNLGSGNLRRTQAALGKAQAGTGLARIVCGGTSITEGVADGTARPNVASYPVYLRKLLAARGYTVAGTGMVSTWNNNSTNGDSRWAFGSAWTTAVNRGNVARLCASTTNNVATFTSDAAGTIAEVVYLNTNGIFTVSVDGASSGVGFTTVTGGSTSEVKSVALTGLGDTTHVITITSTSSATVAIVAAGVRESTGLLVNNIGVGSSDSADYTTTSPQGTGAASYYNAVSIASSSTSGYSPDLYIYEGPINDAFSTHGLTPANTLTNVQTIAQRFISQGVDVMLVVSPAPQLTPYSSNTAISSATWDTYRQSMYSAADALNVPLIDMTEALGLRTTVVTNGIDYDGVHLVPAGYATMAQAVMAAILA